MQLKASWCVVYRKGSKEREEGLKKWYGLESESTFLGFE